MLKKNECTAVKESYRKLKLCPSDENMNKYTLWVIICKGYEPKKKQTNPQKTYQQEFAKGINIHNNPLLHQTNKE